MKYSDNKFIDRDSQVIFYCKEWCDYLQKIINLSRETHQSFTFINLRFDIPKAKELVTELGNPLILPILSFNGIYYEKPPFSKVENI